MTLSYIQVLYWMLFVLRFDDPIAFPSPSLMTLACIAHFMPDRQLVYYRIVSCLLCVVSARIKLVLGNNFILL